MKLFAGLVAITLVLLTGLIAGGYDPGPILDFWRILRGS